MIWVKGKWKYFRKRGWTHTRLICPSWQIFEVSDGNVVPV